MSKSTGNVIYADDLVSFYGVDAVRYFLLSQMPYDNDGIINWDIVTETVNGELANVYGNLVSRTIAMSNKYFGGVLEDKGVVEPVDDELKAVVTGAYKKVADKIDAYKVADALGEIFTLFRRANKYIDETMPWALAKDETKKDRLATVLYNLSEAIIIGTTLLESFMPETAEKVYKEFNTTARDFDRLGEFGLLSNGTKVTDAPEILFKRLDAKEISEKVNAMYEARKPKETKKPENVVEISEIGIEDFMKVQLRVGEIVEAEKVKKANKLLKFSVKIGDETRTIVSGIAKYYTPEEMVGKQVVVVSNLKPAKLCGIESQGMLLCACTDDELTLVTPEKRMPTGATVR
jgi:methionyl-tRNA synthetase